MVYKDNCIGAHLQQTIKNKIDKLLEEDMHTFIKEKKGAGSKDSIQQRQSIDLLKLQERLIDDIA